MSRATQALHASAEKWLPKNTRQQLSWVVLVSCVLLLGVQTTRWLGRVPEDSSAPADAVTSGTTDPVSTADAAVAVNAPAAPDAQDEVLVVDAVAVAVDDSAADAKTAPQDEEQAAANLGQDRALEQQTEPAANLDIVAQVFAALSSPGQAKIGGAEAQPDREPAGFPDFFAALARTTAPSQDSPAERQARLRGIEYLFTLHAPPASQEVAEFFARQLAHDKHEASPQDIAQTPVMSEPATAAVTASSEAPSETPPNAAALAETDAGQSDSTAAPSEPAAGLAAQADTAATVEKSRQELPSAELVLVNPVESGGTILYLVEGQAFSLAPGQSHRLPADRPWRVAFHRGDDFGDTEILLSTGEFKFAVGPQGWQLVPADER
jgi:hypothetical protein